MLIILEKEMGENVDALISAVQRYPELYDPQNKYYKDSIRKNNAWIKVTEESDYESVMAAKKKWKLLRDYYSKVVREEKTKTGQAAPAKVVWPYKDQMEFLRDSVSYPRTESNITINVEDNSDEENEKRKKRKKNDANDTDSLICEYLKKRRSCNSPDCPYHAVPTRRESGSSEETCPQVGPSLGLFKSSSLESLQTMVQEQQKQGLISPAVNNISSRGCNESFRAAVDKSFEASNQTETSDLQVLTTQQASSVRNHTRAKTVDVLSEQAKKSDKGKKKGIFRGLGSMFRFGKSSKKSHKEVTVSAAKEFNKVNSEPARMKPRSDNQYQTTCKEVSDELQHSNQFHPQQNQTFHRQLSSRASFTFPRIGSSSTPSQNELKPLPQNQQDRMNVLRLEHQRRHKQRNGFYPRDNEEELYEQQMKQSMNGKAMKNRPLPPLPNQQASADASQVKVTEMSPKSKSLEIYKEMSKPGSRKGFADPVRYSHYMNFQEIQQHLQQFHFHQNLFSNEQSIPSYLYDQTRSSNKRHYRHTVSSPRSRPVSEFIDFHNAETYKHVLRGMPESGSLPKRMFPNSKQRPPIPSAFMFQERHDQVMPNGYPAVQYNQNINEFHRNTENASSSKV